MSRYVLGLDLGSNIYKPIIHYLYFYKYFIRNGLRGLLGK